MEDRRLRVAHFVQRYPPALGGSEAYFARLSEYLASQACDVTVYTTSAYDLEAFWSHHGKRIPAKTIVQNGVAVRRYPLFHFPGQRQVLRMLSLLPVRSWQLLTMSCNPICWRMLADALRPIAPFDLVHATAIPYGWPLFCARTLARQLKVPFVITPFLHLGDPDDPIDRTRQAYTAPAFMQLLATADRVFVQTNVERDALLRLNFPEQKVVLQGLGVDRASCTGGDRHRARNRWGIPPVEVVVGHLANNSVEKGTVDLLRAAAKVWNAGERFRVLLAGPEMPNFRRFWERFSMKQNVVRLGVLSDEEKRDFFAGIDVFALPSGSDSFGLVFLEAWANGLPNIAYRAGGVPGVIRNGQDGLLVKCGDINALARALVQLCRDAQLRRTLGGNGEQRLDREFRWVDKLAMVAGVYRELTRGLVSDAS
jgi:glycosyltransferase involved in cell wall biosynthesis